MRKWRWLLLAALSLLVACAPAPSGTDSGTQTLITAEAVRGDWDSQAPPASGWTPVTLLDLWDKRWPDHNGVVWYRLSWQQDDVAPIGLLLDYTCMASAIHLNGSLIARDPSLVEPLSRAWTRPRHFLLDAPLLRQGENTLLVRVSGFSGYQPGFGTVTLGNPAAVQAQYQRSVFVRHTLRVFNMAISAVLGSVFLLIWLLRSQDSTYGWFALAQFAGSLYAYNYIATSPWPLTSTHAWQAAITVLYLCAVASFTLFLLRFCGRRLPRVEWLMGLACVAAFIAAVLAPNWMGPARLPWLLLGGAFYYLGIGYFLWHASRSRRTDQLVLAACLLLPLLVSLRDFAVFLGWVRSGTYLLSVTSLLTLLGIGFAVSYRFVNAMRRVEGFNAELQAEVSAATGQLADTLQREHALALHNTRMGERLNLVRDLHDGFGGTLVGAISELEHAAHPPTPGQMAVRLKEVRDDLRLIIESTLDADATLAELLAPLRHRWSQRLELAGMDSQWRLHGLEELRLGSAAHLDVLRLLQEALTNVLKHSQARQVDVEVSWQAGQLLLRVQDDGLGISNVQSNGAGLASLKARALRLGGPLQWETPSGGGTRLSLVVALPA